MKKVSKGRLHLITSCTECHKRKQKVYPQRNGDESQANLYISATKGSLVNTARGDTLLLPAYTQPGEPAHVQSYDLTLTQRREMAALQHKSSRTSTPQPPTNRGLPIRYVPELSDAIPKHASSSTDVGESANQFPNLGDSILKIPLNDDLLEPLDVADAGTAYQKLLSLMISSQFPPLNADTGLNQECPHNSDYSSEADFKHCTEKLKWELWQTTNGGVPKTCFGISSVEPLHYLPIKPTVLNGELLQICELHSSF